MIRRLCMPLCLLVVAFTLVAPVGVGMVHAQSASQTVNGGNGMRVSPVRNDLTIKPGESQSIQVYVQNITESPANLQVIINDFVASADESGTPRLLLNTGDSAPTHGLKQYVAKVPDVTLQPKEQKIVKVQINIPANAAGGGYYGAVRFLPTSIDKSKNVSLSASVGSLILVTVPGDVKVQAGISSFNVVRGDNGKASNFFTKSNDLKIVARFKNTGNVQVEPFGKIIIKKSGKILATYEVNNTTPRGSILPDSVRRFTVPLGNKNLGLGKYVVEGNFGYGTSGQLLSASTSFFVLPSLYIGIAVALLIVLILAAVIFPRMLRTHDRKLLRKVRRGKN
jgi:hypothetical protein